MAKGGKGSSSASSATRKKHARKAAAALYADEPPPEKHKNVKSKEKGKKKEPRQKVYIPPVKPPPAQPDPLDTTGLARLLPPDLLVVLRKLGKKNALTKISALEELNTSFVEKCGKKGSDDSSVATLVLMMPVWLHRIPALFTNPSRRIRFLTSYLHTSLLRISDVREQIFLFIQGTASVYQCESILGTWCMAAHDVDRQVSSDAAKSWKDAISRIEQPGKLPLDETLTGHLLSFVQKVLLDPGAVYLYLNPVQLMVAPTPPRKASGRSTPIPLKKEITDPTARAKIDEDEESEQDRKARLRVGALGAIGWMLDARSDGSRSASTRELTDILSNPATWTSLHFAESSSIVEIESFGWNQPIVRKAAWNILQTLLRTGKDMEPFLPVLGPAVLRSAWVEPDALVQNVMWQPLLTFLREFPQVWDIEVASEDNKRDDTTADESASDGDAEEDVNAATAEHQRKSLAYQEFLQFLELGCSGSPRENYPSVVIILSTIPSHILASTHTERPISDFFASFWAAIDGRAFSALERVATSAAFLSSLLDCIILLVKRIRNGDDVHAHLLLGKREEGASRDAVLEGLVREQFRRVWESMTAKNLKAEENVAGKTVAQALMSLNAINEGLFRTAWDLLSVAITEQALSPRSETPTLAPTFLKAFNQIFGEGSLPKDATNTLTRHISLSSLAQCESVLGTESSESSADVNSLVPLINIINTFGQALFGDADFARRMDTLMTNNAFKLLSTTPSLLLAYFSCRQDEERTLALWHILLSEISQQPTIPEKALSAVLDATQKGTLPRYLKPKANELDAMMEKWLADSLSSSGGTSQMHLLCQLLRNADHFLSDTSIDALLRSLYTSFSLQVGRAVHDAAVSPSTFEASVGLIKTAVEHWPKLTLGAEESMSPLPDIFILSYLLPKCWDSGDNQNVSVARRIWEQWLMKSSTNDQISVIEAIKVKLRDIICDVQARPRPEDVLRMVEEGCPGFGVDLVGDIFLSPVALGASLAVLSPDPISPSLAVLDPLIPPASMFSEEPILIPQCDDLGYSSYARVVSGLLHAFLQDRQLAKNNLWALRHIVALELYASDFLNVHGARSPVFDERVYGSDLDGLISKAQQVTTYLLTSSTDEGWRARVVSAVMEDKEMGSSDGIAGFLVELIGHATRMDNIRESRILRHVLRHVLDKVESDEAERWMLLARRLERKAPQTALAMVTSITEFAPEPPYLDRYRNELAASLLGIPANKADTDGLLRLQRLAATAPDPNSDVIFLPQQRVVNAMKTFQRWITSDDDISEEVESAMTLIFLHIAPILQNVPGGHWDLIFDMIEANLEGCSFTDDSTLVTLARTLRLIIVVQDLAAVNRSLRDDWKPKHTTISTLRDVVTVRLDDVKYSAPRSICRELALMVIQDLPVALVDHTALSGMCHLLTDLSGNVKRLAYQLLQEAAKKRTEHLVVEAGVDTEGNFKAELPDTLLDILRQTFDAGDEAIHDGEDLFGYLLGWMILFDLFTHASLKVRSSYVDQLRSLDIITTHFIPAVFGLLNLYSGLLKAFKLDIWGVDEFHVQFSEPDSLLSTQLLAAHLYYRSLLTIPSLIRTCVLEYKDKQLYSTVITYTSQNFSQVLIQAELAHIKSAESMTELADEHLSIKVAANVNEVTASYLVDDQQLEMVLKMPSDWPLHAIEIKETKKVGVLENKWRAWVLAVQQTIWAHNGRIADGLSLFKKNVSLHFQGQVECPICYSIISVTDATLPKKSCKTCKNKFHSGCLYKWFNTSHSSRCPLCRSDIF